MMNKKGMTLAEVLIAVTIFLVFVVGAYKALVGSRQVEQTSQEVFDAYTISVSVLDNLAHFQGTGKRDTDTQTFYNDAEYPTPEAPEAIFTPGVEHNLSELSLDPKYMLPETFVQDMGKDASVVYSVKEYKELSSTTGANQKDALRIVTIKTTWKE